MADLVVIVPSRGRPGAVGELVEAFEQTCTEVTTDLVFAVDGDDEFLSDYQAAVRAYRGYGVLLTAAAPSTMVATLNYAAGTLVADREPSAIGFMGDDHRPRTKGWDAAYLDALRDMGTGIVYGNDLLQRGNLPTQVAMTADIIRTLGYMAPPGLTHLAVDNAWLALGQAADCIRYLPDVVVEHRHPAAGKAAWDEGYQRVNSAEMYERDGAEFARWAREDLPYAAAKVKALR
jgi:hypothetical protein